MKKFKRILIANRAEIALRIIHTCKKMGIETVSIYSEKELGLAHQIQADFSACLGSGSLAETYLNIDKIVAIAKEFKVDAIHPGYGFLSENTHFAKKLEQVGIEFIGPSAESIELMGDKQGSKIAMQKASIPLIPGYHGDNQDLVFLKEKALEIGFPALIKASSGGGGKGMRIVESEAEFEEAILAAKNEAKKSFGDDRVLIEKYITKPRHIEVQLMSDTHGNHLHFFERECSVQRRYQKVIEESPSPALTPELRQKICQTACQIAKEINYRGAGTVEFILDEKNQFYFLEMNTRLQVEHPITEMVTATDLVELQIKVAQGEKINLTQDQITQKGHAIECRLYAEEPDNNFLPSIGKLTTLTYPQGPCVRVDYGYLEGDEVSLDFDPMLAMLIVWGSDRSDAINRMRLVLKELRVLGVKTNRLFMLKLLDHHLFQTGDYDTNLIKSNLEQILVSNKENEEKKIVLAAAISLLTSNQSGTTEQLSSHSSSAWEKLVGFRNV